jgi:glucose-6-phosphate 1-epimerase
MIALRGIAPREIPWREEVERTDKAAPPSLEQLQDRYGIRGALTFEAGRGGLIRVGVTTPQAEAHIYLHGGHVTHYEPRRERPVLFLSEQSRFESGAPIRGGVPIVFPWFGPKAGDPAPPMHGFARLADWRVESATQAADGSVVLALELESNLAAHPAWAHPYTLRYLVIVGRTLTLQFEVGNPSAGPISFEEALHTYLAVGDVRGVSVAGLEGVRYVDKTDAMTQKQQGHEPLRLVGETDRVYLNTQATCTVEDPTWGRRLIIEKVGSEGTVVWNPWVAKARAMPDFGDAEWPRMLCVETCNVADHRVVLPAGQRHLLRAVIRCEPL